MDKLSKFYQWYTYTSHPIGLIGLAVILGLLTRTVISTGTCMAVGYSCEHAYQAQDAIADSMFELIDGNKGQDIVIKPKSKR